MRILFVCDAGSTHTQRWAEYFRDRGDEVYVASFRHYDIYGATVHVLPTYGLGKAGYPFAVFALRNLYRTIKPDVVHAQHVTSYGFVAALANIKPLVVTAWGTDVLLAPLKSILMRAVVRYALKRADAITTVAEHMNKSVRDLVRGNKNIQAIPFGVDTTFFKMISQDKQENEPIRLICTRNFAPIYDVATLIKAVSMLKEKGLVVKTMLAGDGPLKDALENLVKCLGLQNEVTFLGHLSQEALVEHLNESGIFVTPALSDGNNVSLNEAMACGCFPIATEIPANTQWIKDGYNGYLYPPGNARILAETIEKALNNQEFRQKSRLINRKIVEESANWEFCVEKMEKIYTSLIQGRKGLEEK